MISIIVLSVLAGGFAYSMKVETKLAQNTSYETELIWLGRSGVERARWVLGLQLAFGNEPYDSLNQKWAGGPGSFMISNSPLAEVDLNQPVELGNGKITSIKIVDLERKANINLANEGMLQHALTLMGVDAVEASAIAGAILDWIDPDNATHPGGAETDYYLGCIPPYEAKNGPIDDMAELLLIKGVTPEIFWGQRAPERPLAAFQARDRLFTGARNELIPYTAGLVELFTPISSGRININTASAAVLQLVSPLIDSLIAAEIIKLRAGPDGVDGTEDDTPFRNPGELINVPGLSRQAVESIMRVCDVRSRTFEVTVDVEVAGYKRQFKAVLGRNSPQDIQVLSFYGT
ncbi:MAG: general secretion pathway protein GspK [Verrucomicrobiales bacterium]|nr:general secretion pathway protein GspK [Verrucomicrobiales bacterium]